MPTVRLLIRRHPLAAALLFAAALALRVLIPGGFMPALDHGKIVVTICTGSPDGPSTMVMDLPGTKHPAGDQTKGKCAFADLALAMTGTPAPFALAALAFVMALALTMALTLPPRPAARLRPPLRGPPRPV